MTSNPTSPLQPLTPRQQEALELAAQGFTNSQIAYRMGVSEHTVKAHLALVYRRLQVTNRTAAVAAYVGAAHPAQDPPQEPPVPQYYHGSDPIVPG